MVSTLLLPKEITVKEILLTQNMVALVDDEDYEYLMQWKWSAVRIGKRVYACRAHRYRYMHRLINKTPAGLQTDHINGNGLDNRKCNLRTVTKAQNMMNQEHGRGKYSKYKGVCYCPERKKWQAGISINGKRKALGRFDSEIDAAMAYNVAAKERYGEYFHPNIIDIIGQ